MMKLGFNASGITKALDKIPTTYTVIAVLAINALIFAAAYMTVFMPQQEQKASMASEYAKLKNDLDRVTVIKNNMNRYRQEYAQTRENLRAVLRQLPEKKDIPNLLRSVSTVGAESGTKIKYFEPKSIINKEFYGEMPLEMKFSGSFHNIGYFFDGIRKLERIIDIYSFSLDAKGSPVKVTLEGTCMARTYVYVHEPQKPKGQPQKSAKDGTSAKPASK